MSGEWQSLILFAISLVSNLIALLFTKSNKRWLWAMNTVLSYVYLAAYIDLVSNIGQDRGAWSKALQPWNKPVLLFMWILPGLLDTYESRKMAGKLSGILERES